MQSAAALVMLGCGAGPALAVDGAPGDAGSQVAVPRAPAVIVPHGDIDPGMRVRPPRLPPGTTPVIKPRTTPAPGSNTVVVPR